MLRRERPTCEQCRRRKVRCNRHSPCSQCSRLHLPCRYEHPTRKVSIQPHPRPATSSSPIPDPQSSEANLLSNQIILDKLVKFEELLTNLNKTLNHDYAAPKPANCSVSTPTLASGSSSADVLVGDGEKGNFVNSSVFVELFLDEERSGRHRRHNNEWLATPCSIPQFGLIPQYGTAATDVLGPEFVELPISPQMYIKLWTIYLQNIDPLVKLLHIPTTRPLILNAVAHPGGTEDSIMALLYAAGFAATTSVSRIYAVEQLGFERITLLRYFMRQMDRALMRLQFLLRPNVQALTAYVIYLTALRAHDAGRSVWTLTGLAIRVAESLGVHRDGAALGLNVFDTEMRRRLWWQLTALDATAPENHGLNSTMVDRNRIIRLPTNMNDIELTPQMPLHPTETDDWTEMTFAIMNFDLCRSLRHIVLTSKSSDVHAKQTEIDEVERATSRRWFGDGNTDHPMYPVAGWLLRISAMKTRFILVLQEWLAGPRLSDCKYRDLPHSIFTTAVELLEIGYLLQSGKVYRGFAWFFQQQPQLYALFLVLHSLRDFPNRMEADRAWRAVDDYFTCLIDFEEASERKGKTSCVWSVLRPLYDRAKKSSQVAVKRRNTQLPSKEPAENEPTGLNHQCTILADGTDLRGPNEPLVEHTAFDNILGWQDLPDWFDLELGII